MSPAESERQTLIGVAFGLSAFLFWGLSPIYFRAVAAVEPFELLAHRVVWSALFLAPMVLLGGGLRPIRRALAEPTTLLALAVTTLLISANWLIFIVAIASERLLEVSLGYYLNPLVNVLLGLVFLGERMGRLRWAGVALAAAGVANLALRHEGFPWISLGLALTFGVYGLIRKRMPLGARDGLFLETLLMLPPAALFLLWLGASGDGLFLVAGDLHLDLLLLASGLVTALPLLWFTAAARRLQLATIGVMQYLAPSLHFLLAVLVYGEAFTPVQAVTFGCIWMGVALFTTGSLRDRRRAA